MPYRALLSFSGLISMASGEIRDISDIDIVKDLLKAGYIEEYNPEPNKVVTKSKTNTKRKEKKA